MHEFAVTQQLLEIARESARALPAPARVRTVFVSIGALTGIAEESMRFYFDALAAEMGLTGAQLVVERRPAVAECRACGLRAPVEPPLELCCPGCGAQTLTVTGGRELVVERVELEVETANEAGEPERNLS